MRGVLKDCFEISGRGVIAALLPQDNGALRAGDWIKIDDASWRVAGIDMINYGSRPIPSVEVRAIIGALLAGASKAELTPLIGRTFETSSHLP